MFWSGLRFFKNQKNILAAEIRCLSIVGIYLATLIIIKNEKQKNIPPKQKNQNPWFPFYLNSEDRKNIK